MVQFKVQMTGETFNACTEQYVLFRRAREIAGGTFRIVVLVELAAAVAALVLAVTQQESGWLPRGFFLLAAGLLSWQAVRKVRGTDTRSYIKKARAQVLPPEEAEKELEVSFDEEGCTLRAPGSTLPGQDVEERRLFSYGQVSGLFRSESYFLVACDKASSICFPLAGLTGGTAEELTSFLETQCGRKAMHYALETEKFQALLR